MCHKFMAHPLFPFLRSFFIGFHGWIGGILACRITHGISRIFGLWPMAGARNIPLLFLSRRFRRWRRFFFVEVFCPTDFADIHRFSSSWFFFIGFHGWIGGILAYRITHGISQNFGRWPMAGARYMLLLFFCPTDFTDIHRFFMESLVNLFVSLRGYLQRPDRSHPWKSVSNRRSRKSPNKFRVIRWIKSASSVKSAWLKKTPMKNLCISVKSVGLFLTSGGIFNDRIGRLRVNPWVITLAGNLRINSVSSDE